ncbi:MAG: hypothetical protein U1E62_08510 [Alsobacter sp.]
MKTALLPTVALGAAMSTFFLPPVLALTGAAPTPAKPVPMLVVQAEDGPALAKHRAPAGQLSTSAKGAPAGPASTPVSMPVSLTRVASR